MSKQIVDEGETHRTRIAVETDGIRDRVTLGASQRDNLHSWGFAQLRAFLEYKAKRAGVPMVTVDPRNTSRTCPVCGNVDKANRKTQSVFLCVSCGHAGHADHIAARNISGRALVSAPDVATSSRSWLQALALAMG